ncbi:phosphoglycolate phosphatase [Chenggangzhangella methanolivorans]|uniref:Phosphoglycolate phosphatase n=1 Tax=Chenggangzhangella methanolivorans TaxID=1437009 RepID=A0A9E6UNA8_9HYPH|nr:phosphoglycolate phosphatase [Chenggangzhangella methanolivorans]QZO00856.1 phosphoglycolate phosphatase [Chenggangzhangella methanolivorans]
MTNDIPLTVVFDLDGTLVETAPDLIAALTVSLAADGAPPLPYEQGRDLIGAGARALVERGLEAAGRRLEKSRVDELHAIFLEHYGAHIADESRPYPGCLEALDRLRASGAKLAVCTNKVERLARQLLDTLEMTDKFDVIVGGDTFPTSKPDPQSLLGAIQRAGGDVARAVMVGDAFTDVGAAKNAGVPVVVMSFGYTVTPPHELGGDVVIDHFDELEGAIAALVPAV